MPQIVTCPECGRSTTLPESFDQNGLVRCPLCSGEFLPSEANTADADVGEPEEAAAELVPIDRAEAENEEGSVTEATGDAADDSSPEQPSAEEQTASEPTDAVESAAGEEEATHEEQEPAEEDQIVQVRCPCCEEEYGLDEVIVATTGSPLGTTVASAVDKDGALKDAGVPAAGGTGLDAWAHDAPQIDVGGVAQPQAADGAAFDLQTDESGTTDSSPISNLRRKRKGRQKGLLRELAGWVFGGLGGLLIAYYALNWIKGERGNFLKIPLPGVPHTYKYSPEWFPDWLKDDSDSEGDASVEAES
ncbi:MAG: hypothetical protein ACYTG0_01755 [Planctomycetota bacterium]|jgi:hypothetical protein